MAVLRGWKTGPGGVPAKGSSYSRYKNRKLKIGVEYVNKHTGEVRDNVKTVGRERKYQNFYGNDKIIHPIRRGGKLVGVSVGGVREKYPIR